MPCSPSRGAMGTTVLPREGCGGRPGCVAGGDRDTIAGVPVPPSGGQETLRGHPSLRPGCCWAQQTFPSQASHSHHPGALPGSSSHPNPTHGPTAGQRVLPALLPHVLLLGPRDCIKHHHRREGGRNSLQVQFVNHIKYSPVESLGFHPAQGEHRETWLEIHSFCP